MRNFMKTIVNAIQHWTKGKIKESTADWNQTNPNADNYIRNKPTNLATVEQIEETQTTAENAQTTADGKMDANNPVGTGSFSMGRKANTTVGYQSHAEGSDTTASGSYSHAEGRNTITGDGVANAAGANLLDTVGCAAHAEGFGTVASGGMSHAEGSGTLAFGRTAHAEGYKTTASGDYSHAEGYKTTASGDYSHAEGYNTRASAQNAVSEGQGTVANFRNMKASGAYNDFSAYVETITTGSMSVPGSWYAATGTAYSVSENGFELEGTVNTLVELSAVPVGSYIITKLASNEESGNLTTGTTMYHILSNTPRGTRDGRNIEYEQHSLALADSDKKGTFVHVVGNGTSNSARSNAHTLDWEGNAWYAGDVYVGSTSGTNKDDGSKKLATEEYVDTSLTDKITIPVTAAVGQVIAVTAVDENGKPTEWEAVEKANEIIHGRKLALVTFTEDTTGVTITDINADVTEFTIVWKATTSIHSPTLTINDVSWAMSTGSWGGKACVFLKIDRKNEKMYAKYNAANGGVNCGVFKWAKDEILESVSLSSLGFSSGCTFAVYEGLLALLTTQNGGIVNTWLP